MKRVLYIVLGLLVVLVAGGAFAISRIDTVAMSKKVAELTAEHTGKPLVLQQVPSISFIPLGLSFGQATWGMVDGKAAPEGISVSLQGGKVSLQLAPLLSGNIVVDSVELQSPTITVRPDSSLAKAQPAPNAAGTATAEPLRLPAFSLGQMRITNGTVDLNTGTGPGIRISKLDMSVKNLAPQQLASTQFSLHLTVHESSPKGLGPILLAGTVQHKAEIRLSPSQVDVQGLDVTFTPEEGFIPVAAGPVRLSGELAYVLTNGKLTLTKLACSAAHAQMTLTGAGQIQPLSFTGKQSLTSSPDKMLHSLGIKGPVPTMPTAFSLNSDFNFTDNTLDIPRFEATLDKSPITGALRIAMPQQGRALNIKSAVQVGNLNLDAYLGDADTASSQPAPEAKKASQNVPIFPATKVTNLPTVDADLQVSALTVRKVTVNSLRLQAKGATGRYTLHTTGTLATGGSINITQGLDLGTHRYSSSGQASNINVGKLMHAMQGKSPVGGTAQLNFELLSGGATVADIQSSVSGKGAFMMQDIVLTGVSILPKDASTKGSVPSNFERLNAPFTAKNGIFSINPITLNSPTLTARGLGTVNLPQEQLHLSADVNLLGLSLPVVASGPFNALSYGLDPQKMLKNVLSSPETLGKGAGLLLQKGGKTAPDVGGAIKGLFGK